MRPSPQARRDGGVAGRPRAKRAFSDRGRRLQRGAAPTAGPVPRALAAILEIPCSRVRNSLFALHKIPCSRCSKFPVRIAQFLSPRLKASRVIIGAKALKILRSLEKSAGFPNPRCSFSGAFRSKIPCSGCQLRPRPRYFRRASRRCLRSIAINSPRQIITVSIAEPPQETSGSGMPTTGARPITIIRLTAM